MSTWTGTYQIWKAPEGGGAAVQVTRNGGFNAFEAPDGQRLYYTKDYMQGALWSSAPRWKRRDQGARRGRGPGVCRAAGSSRLFPARIACRRAALPHLSNKPGFCSQHH
jgi:hypothetical protein